MTTTKLEKTVSASWSGYGHQQVTITFRGKQYTCTSTNTMATDRLHTDCSPRKEEGIYTLKQAYMALFNECKRKNNLR